MTTAYRVLKCPAIWHTPKVFVDVPQRLHTKRCEKTALRSCRKRLVSSALLGKAMRLRIVPN
ncbi:hypothetical protein KCP73_15655 [Salmonella enterica subsp. enterica]|nr:hypothetical protein KCP73_15655 [Salmonella enterica subsp. enterica]